MRKGPRILSIMTFSILTIGGLAMVLVGIDSINRGVRTEYPPGAGQGSYPGFMISMLGMAVFVFGSLGLHKCRKPRK
jgi:hypothetical protein